MRRTSGPEAEAAPVEVVTLREKLQRMHSSRNVRAEGALVLRLFYATRRHARRMRIVQHPPRLPRARAIPKQRLLLGALVVLGGCAPQPDGLPVNEAQLVVARQEQSSCAGQPIGTRASTARRSCEGSPLFTSTSRAGRTTAKRTSGERAAILRSRASRSEFLARTLMCRSARLTLGHAAPASNEPYFLPDGWLNVSVRSGNGTFVVSLASENAEHGREISSGPARLRERPASRPRTPHDPPVVTGLWHGGHAAPRPVSVRFGCRHRSVIPRSPSTGSTGAAPDALDISRRRARWRTLIVFLRSRRATTPTKPGPGGSS